MSARFLPDYARLLIKLDRYEDALATLEEAYEILNAVDDVNRTLTGYVIDLLVHLHERWDAEDANGGHAATAAEWRALRETPGGT